MDNPAAQFTPAMMPRRRPDHTTPVRSDSDGFTLSGHAAQQARAKGWSEDEVLAAANDPHTTYANGRYEGQMRHIRGDMVAVVHPDSKKVVTVYQNVKETDLRPDQSDADAQRYGARRGRA
jgi:hypothetical protein